MKTLYKVAVFDDEEKMISSTKKLIASGYDIHDVFTPYPVHEVLKVLKRKTRLPVAAYFLGLFGAIAVLAFLYYTSVISWPIVYGGKPYNAFPSFIIITIVLTILTVTLGSLAIFSASSKLYPGRDNTIFDLRATDDKFIIVLWRADMDDKRYIDAGVIFNNEGAIEVMDKEYDTINT